MARRLAERDVLGMQHLDTWDAHRDAEENHGRHACEVDPPIAGPLVYGNLLPQIVG